MKLVYFIFMMIFSISSFAAWNEVECEGKSDGKTIRVEIEQSFPNDSHFKRAELTVTENGANENHSYTVSRHRFGLNRIEYRGAGFQLEVDLWPDQRPRWGMRYAGTLLSSALGNEYIRGLRCQFPNAH